MIQAVLLFPRTHMSPLGLMMDKVRCVRAHLLLIPSDACECSMIPMG